jgi:hypothetical protein
VRKRQRRRRRAFVGLLAFGALALTAAALWRWLRSAPTPTERLVVPGATPAAAAVDEFSAAERQRLEAILQQKNPEAQR